MSFPFDAWLRAGVTALGLSPAEVWASALRDLNALATPETTALDTAGLAALCALFPDADDGDNDG